MTGGLKYYRDASLEPTHARVLFYFASGYHLAFDDQRLFGKVDLIEDPADFIEEKKLELDPLDLDFPAFRERLEGRRGEIKAKTCWFIRVPLISPLLPSSRSRKAGKSRSSGSSSSFCSWIKPSGSSIRSTLPNNRWSSNARWYPLRKEIKTLAWVGSSSAAL